MDPQIKSTLTTVLAAMLGGGVTWAVKEGIVSSTDQAAVTNAIVGLILFLVGVGVTWWKARQHTPAAQIAAVNAAPNGVKVVAATAPVPEVNEPIVQKGTSK